MFNFHCFGNLQKFLTVNFCQFMVYVCMSVIYHLFSRVSYGLSPNPYILWVGDNHPFSQDFSVYNNKSIGDFIRRYKSVVENGTFLDFM